MGSIQENLSHLNNKFKNIISKLDTDEDSLEEARQNLEDINQAYKIFASQIKQKEESKAASLYKFYQAKKQYLDLLEQAKEALIKLEDAEQKNLVILKEKAEILHQIRQKAALMLQEDIKDVCQNLFMPHARLRVSFFDDKNFSEDGLYKISFDIETNKGEGFRPLSSTVSGGEAARLLLAIKKILVETQNNSLAVPSVLVLDEIDAGVSGDAALAMAKMLREMADFCQILCVTHSPSVAAGANFHFKIAKRSYNSRVISEIKVLDYEEKVSEIASLFAGENQGESSRLLAKDLLAIFEK